MISGQIPTDDRIRLPCVYMVDSSATTGRPVATASRTSSDTWKNLLFAKSETLLEICLQERSRVGDDVLGQLRSRAARAIAMVATPISI